MLDDTLGDELEHAAQRYRDRRIEEHIGQGAICRGLGEAILQQAIRQTRVEGGDETILSNRVEAALNLVDLFRRNACIFRDREEKSKQGRSLSVDLGICVNPRDIAWRHVELDRLTREEYLPLVVLDADILRDIARCYVALGWLRSDLFEWLLFDALVASDIRECSLWWRASAPPRLESKLAWFGLGVRIARLAGAAVAFPAGYALYRWGSGRAWDAPPLAAFLAYGSAILLWIRGLLLRRNEADEQPKTIRLLDAAKRAYSALPSQETAISVRAVRETLVRATDQGVVWSPEVYALVDSACSRKPPIWVLPPASR